ncbi:PH domain-containing protein [Microbacterium sp.]|uniref:PH domain-containing protein n=1 Tax=Microbacterium sp. TaxID=51671 RepID=UPI003A899D0A
MPQPVVFRPRGGVVLAAAAVVMCAVTLGYIGVTDGLGGVLRWGWPIVALAWAAWLLFIRPSVTVTDGFVEIDNVFRSARVPWGDLADVQTRFALTVHTADGRGIRAWAAPAPSARRALGTRREEVSRTPGDGQTRRPSDAEGTESGDAATLVRRAIERHRRSGGTDRPGGTVRTWHRGLLATTILLAAAAVWSLAQTAGHG